MNKSIESLKNMFDNENEITNIEKKFREHYSPKYC